MSDIQSRTFLQHFLYEYSLYFPVVLIVLLITTGVTIIFKDSIASLIRLQILLVYTLVHAGIVSGFVVFGNKYVVRQFIQNPLSLFKKTNYLYQGLQQLPWIIQVLLVAALVASLAAGALNTFLMVILVCLALQVNQDFIDYSILVLGFAMALLALLFSWGYMTEYAVFALVPLFIARIIKQF